MKTSIQSFDHRIMLKKEQIVQYKAVIKNYGPAQMAEFGTPHLERLESELRGIERERANFKVSQ